MNGRGSIMVLSPWPGLLSMGGGGTPRIRDLVDTLLAAGYSVDYVAPASLAGEPIPPREGLRVHRFTAPRIAFPGYVGRWLSWAERTIRITACVLRVGRRHGRPRVVYACSSLTVPGAVVSRLFLRRPVIGAFFGTFLYHALGRPLDLLYYFEESIAFKSPIDRFVILDDGTCGYEVARAFGVPDERIRFWMHGLDLENCTAAMDADAREELGLPPDAPLVVSASRLVGWKRVERILRAAPEVLAARPDTVFAIAGEGGERAALEKLAGERSIAHAVRFLGALPRDLNLRLIASADVFCALYDHSSVGVALLEALGCGRAVIVADTGATRHFVEDEVNGLVVGAGDTRATAAAITRLVTTPALRGRLGNEARRIAYERYLTPEQRASLELETIADLALRRDGVRRRDH